MSEFCFDSVPSKSNKIWSILLSNLYLLCSFIFLHPLHFFLIAFFSPCLLKILCFLSPVFITTFLLLTLLVAVDKLRADADTDNDEFQVYKTVFEAPAFETRQDSGETCAQASEEEPVDKCVIQGRSQVLAGNLEADPAAEVGVKQGFLVGNDGAEDFAWKRNKDQPTRRSKSKEKGRSCESIHEGGDERSIWPKVGQDQRGFSPSLGSSGSGKKEKEWKRTLACKLFEERHNRGAEGMDMLWETQGTESSRMQLNKGRQGSAPTYGEEEDGGDDDDVVGVKICCLQALKFSAAKKMNTGIGRPSMIRFSKAVKGIGWLPMRARNRNR